jgi:hypothetical protein
MCINTGVPKKRNLLTFESRECAIFYGMYGVLDYFDVFLGIHAVLEWCDLLWSCSTLMTLTMIFDYDLDSTFPPV